MEDSQPLLDLLLSKFAWAPTFFAVVGALRMLCKPFSLALQSFIGRALRYVHDTQEADDDAFVAAILKRRWYRWLAFAVDYVASVKLPLELPPPSPFSRDA